MFISVSRMVYKEQQLMSTACGLPHYSASDGFCYDNANVNLQASRAACINGVERVNTSPKQAFISRHRGH